MNTSPEAANKSLPCVCISLEVFLEVREHNITDSMRQKHGGEKIGGTTHSRDSDIMMTGGLSN